VDRHQHGIEVHPPLVPLPLEVAVVALGLLDRGVPELVLDPSEIRAGLERPRGVGVSASRGLPVGRLVAVKSAFQTSSTNAP